MKHCPNCGSPWGAGVETWPRLCLACAQTTYKNPIPVVVGLVGVRNDLDCGVLTVRRAASQKYALPGGFIDINDQSWQHAIAREIKEEVGIELDHDRFTIKTVRSSTASGTILIFGCYAVRFLAKDLPLVPPKNHETDDIKVVYRLDELEANPLAFPTHQEMAVSYLKWLMP